MKRICIHSVPRSGSSWLGQIFNSHPNVLYKYQPLFSYAFKGYLDESSSLERVSDFFQKLAAARDEFLDQNKQREEGIIPSFRKGKRTHIVYKEVRYHYILENMLSLNSGLRVIGLIRNPLSVIYSWLKAPKEFKVENGWKDLEEWRSAPKKNLGKKEEYFGFEKWKEVAILFLRLEKLYPQSFMISTYKNLNNDPEREVEKLFEFCDLELSMQTCKFLNESRSRHVDDVYSVFRLKGKDDDWVGRLNPVIEDAIIKELTGTSLERFIL